MADNDDERRARAALIDTNAPNPARVGDYLYGGRDNFEADRKVARAMMTVAPVVGALQPAMRAFRQRVVRYLVAEAGVRQFLDIGIGLQMTTGSTHAVAQSIDPRCRIVYVDSDPVVLAHARALVRSTAEGAARCVDADIFDPAAIMAGARGTLDFARPVALLLATLAFTPDTAAAAAMVSSLLAAMVPSSYVAIHHQASDLHPALGLAVRRWNRQAARKVTLRSADEIASLVAGLDVVPPGLVPICEWRPEPGDPSFEDVVPVHGVVARRP